MDYMEFILSIVAGLAASIPLVVKLIQYVKAAVKEKNWNAVMDLVIQYMQQAEQMFSEGSVRKEWVLCMVKVSAVSVNYDVDMKVISDMIDSLCAMSRVVNSPNTDKDSMEVPVND